MAITLTGEQKRILTLPVQNPILIKGVAGSGKTTVAVYRARHILGTGPDLFEDTNVCIFSFNKSLIKYIKGILGDYDNEGSNILVTTFHKWAYGFLGERGYWSSYKVAKENETKRTIGTVLNQLRCKYPNQLILTKSTDFFKDEIAWLKGKQIYDFQNYCDTKRTGRGTSDRVTNKDKEYIWALFCDYEEELERNKLTDFDDFALLALEYINEEKPFNPPFSHIVVDEAQDLTVAQLTCIYKLLKPSTDSITVIADTAQRIYKSGFSWAGIGINVRGGRSFELKHNYRNTRQIAEAASSLLSHDPQKEDYSQPILPIREGPKPKILFLNTEQEGIFICEQLKKIDLSKESAVVLHRTNGGVNNFSNALWVFGFNPTNISAPDVFNIQQSGIFTCTMFSVKGLEFDHVFLCDINDTLIPYLPELADEKDDLQINTERRLLYTCMTRARGSIYLMVTGKPSRFLAEIDPKTVDIIHYAD